MFNEISRVKFTGIIKQKYVELLPLVSMLYGKDGTVFLKMTDGKWYSQEMAEGAIQGCPLSATLTALVLGDVLRPLDVAMKARACKIFVAAPGDTSDDGAGGETHPMGYIDDVGAATPHEDVLFFLEEFNRLGRPLYLNPSKTRILISTSGECSLSKIEEEYGPDITADLRKAISLH